MIPPEPATLAAWGILSTDYRADVVKTSVAALVDTETRKQRVSWTQAAAEEITSVWDLMARFSELEPSARRTFRENIIAHSDVRVNRSVDLRYEGQEHTGRVALPLERQLKSEGLGALKRESDRAHQVYYEHSSPESPAEIVTLRVSVAGVTRKPKVSPLAEGSGSSEGAVKAHRHVHFHELGDFTECPTYERSKLGTGDRLVGPAVVEEWASTTVVSPNQQLLVGSYGELIIPAL